MRINDDFTIPVTVHAGSHAWLPSPTPGVERRMLFRIGEEKARATSIVRYAPGSHFPHHLHLGGEEFLVLEGVFQDEAGDYPAGSYIRNPPGTGHMPGSAGGCTIFVRLWQFRADDRAQVVCRPGDGIAMGARSNVTGIMLHDDGHEQVRLETWSANSNIHVPNPSGLELLVLDGGFDQDKAMFERCSWVRLPPGRDVHARAGTKGARVWLKAGPLIHDNVVAWQGTSQLPQPRDQGRQAVLS